MSAQNTPTPNLGLNRPPRSLKPWDVLINANFSLLDAKLACFGTAVVPGTFVYFNGTSWTCFPGNTSGTKVLQENSTGVPTWVVGVPGTIGWGGITGTLGSQADLVLALNLKANLVSPIFTTPNIGNAIGSISGTASALAANGADCNVGEAARGVDASGNAEGCFAPPGGGGGGTWGSITGTLSSQTDLQTALNLKAALASPTLTGTPAAPTASLGTNTTQLATTAFVLANAPVSSVNSQVGAVNLGAVDVGAVAVTERAAPLGVATLDSSSLLVQSLVASKIVSGTIDTARLGSGVADAGKLLCGSQAWCTLNLTHTPMTSAGDMMYANGSPSLVRLPIGSDGHIMAINTTTHLPVWDPQLSNVANALIYTGQTGFVGKATNLTPAIDAPTAIFHRYTPSQTANVLEVRAVDETVLMSVSKSGAITAPSFLTTDINGGLDYTEGTGAAITCATGHDIFWPDSTAHRWKMCNNNGTATNVMGASDVLLSAQMPAFTGDVTNSGLAMTAVKINGVAVTGTPSVGYVPTATSSTAATWQAQSGGGSGNNLINYQKITSAVTSAGTTPQTIYTTSVPARAAGEGIRISGQVFHSAGTTGTTCKVLFGATSVSLMVANATASQAVQFEVTVMNDPGSTTAQQMIRSGILGLSFLTAPGLATPAENWASAVTTSLTCELNGAGTSDTWTGRSWIITKIGAN